MKGFDLQLSNMNEARGEKLYYSLLYQVKKGDYNFECGGFSSFSNHFIIMNVIAKSNAVAIISFSSDEYFLMDSADIEFEEMTSSKQTPFKYDETIEGRNFIEKCTNIPGKMFDFNFKNKYFKTCFADGFNTSVAMEDEE